MNERNSNTYVQVCSVCGKQYPVGIDKCPEDGSLLQKAVTSSLVGTVFLGKYDIVSVLGEGGMSIVYKARHKYMEKERALKLLNGDLTNDEVAKERFRREASAASSLSHQNVVVVHDFGFTETEPKQAYLVMDCLEGHSLGDLVENDGAIPCSRAIEIFKQALDGLEHAHKKGIIHRDIKPSNLVIMTDDDGTDLVKLVDFGIAKASPQEGSKARQQLTQTGEIFGSPLYMSPEQCNGRSMDARSDIYSFGCLMYETLSGAPPLIGDTYINTVVKHLQEQPPPFSTTAPHAAIPPAVEAVIMKCLEKDPDKRYSTVAELRQSMLDAALESGVKGYRAGAVPVVQKKSNLGQTFNRMKLSLTGVPASGGQPARPGLLVPLLVAVGIIGVTLAGIFVQFGPPEDRLSMYERVYWAKLLELAHNAHSAGKEAEADKLFKQAEDMARGFEDEKVRLEKTLHEENKVYQMTGAVEQQERIRTELKEIVTNRIRKDYELNQAHLSKLEIPPNSDDEKKKRRDEIRSTGIGIHDISVRLHSRDLHNEEQQLLMQAMRVHENAGLQNAPKMADFKTQLAKCYTEQQHFDKVRDLLIGALNIRKSIERKTAEENRLLSKAYYTLGSFDRDQSNFPKANEELNLAIELARGDSKDSQVLLESLKAKLDLIRQAELVGNHSFATPAQLEELKNEILKLEAKVGSKDGPDLEETASN
ncbi:MAG: serine/threonine protein kinase [Candidatus Obscuribacterales bacterium]|nr:serine/threonine protein kinase [Candidatus Obscuribacterales bacterium]